MIWNVINAAIVIFALLLAYRFWRPVLAALKRFDDANRARAAQERRDKHDPLAHLRHTVATFDEQVDEIGELSLWDVTAGQKITRYTFEGQRYATYEEAELARARKVGGKARRFYAELPAALSAPKDDPKN